MKRIAHYLAAAILAFSMTTIQAQEQQFMSGNSFSYLVPQTNLANRYDHGFGVYANFGVMDKLVANF